jgi:hypothetical protein
LQGDLDVNFNPAVLGLIVPFLLLVLLYFQRTRGRARNRANEAAAERLAAADPTRLLEELLLIDADEGANEPTRRLTAEWFWSVYHGAVGLVLLAAVGVFIVCDAMTYAMVAYVIGATGLVALVIASAARAKSVRDSERIRDALTRVLRSHNLIYGAVIDRTWKVIGTDGNSDQLLDAGLVPLLVGRHGEAMRTYQALAWMPLPQIIMMENSFAIADKPSSTLVVVVFGSRSRFADENAQRTQSISDAIHTEFESRS